MPRPRSHIPLSEKLASALADRLPQAERDALREARVSAQHIIRMFTADHVILHAHGGPDKWWNLTMRRRGPALKAKDARDNLRAKKATRIEDANLIHAAALAEKAGEIRKATALRSLLTLKKSRRKAARGIPSRKQRRMPSLFSDIKFNRGNNHA